MIICPNCGLKQEVGNFCGACGASLKEVSAQAATIENVGASADKKETFPADPNDAITKNSVDDNEVLYTTPLEDTAKDHATIASEEKLGELEEKQPFENSPPPLNTAKKNHATEDFDKKEEIYPSAHQTAYEEPPRPSSTHEQQQQNAYRSAAKPNPTADAYKEKIQGYWGYFVACLKAPSKNTDIGNFKLGLISTIIALLLWVITPFWLLNKTFSAIDNSFSAFFALDSSFDSLGFGVFFRMLLLMGIVYVLSIALTFLLAKSMGTLTSWKEAVTKLGAYNAYVIAGFALTLVLLLLNSLILASIILYLVSSLFIFFVPLYVVISTLKTDYTLDKFVCYLITLASFLVLYIIIYFFFFDKFTNDLQYFNTSF
ncbi:MAG: hypothetical protein KBT36_10625 [Kurthia sp.]|nr:hypothetical protein [Candidatus Kurthia equi]